MKLPVLTFKSVAGVNPVDYKVAEGILKPITPLVPPFVLGYDYSGVVIASKHEDYPVGMRVFGRTCDTNTGTIRRTVLIRPPADCIFKIPDSVSFVDAAALPLVFLTALQSFALAGFGFDDGCIDPSELSVLILGGAGGVGSIAIQLARVLGFKKIFTTASSTKIDIVRGLGATDVVNYKETSILEAIELDSLDFVFDTVGDAVGAFSLLKEFQFCVSISSAVTPDVLPTQYQLSINQRFPVPFYVKPLFYAFPLVTYGHAARYGIEYRYLFCIPNQNDIKKLAELLEQGSINALVAETFPMNEAVKALKKVKAGATVGKIVIVKSKTT